MYKFMIYFKHRTEYPQSSVVSGLSHRRVQPSKLQYMWAIICRSGALGFDSRWVGRVATYNVSERQTISYMQGNYTQESPLP